MASHPQGTKNLPTKRLHSVRWGLFAKKSFIFPLHATSSSSSMDSSTNNSRVVTTTAVVADNNEDQIEAIQMMFTNNCDADGLMTKKDVMNIPYIADLLVC